MRVFVIAVATLALFAGQAVAAEKAGMSEKDKLSYSLGYTQGANMAGFFKAQSIDIDNNVLLDAFKAGLTGGKASLGDQEMRDTMSNFQKTLTAKRAEAMKETGEKNKKAGDAFLAENKKKEGVVTLPDGLQYKILKEGTGNKPTAADKVKVNYKGTLIDGTEFDSSYKRGEPAVFQADKVIAGWTEALQLMKEGSKWEVYIPSNLAYGERGAGPMIGPNATLIFEIELLSIEK
ncbi:MAG TPA: FKBP-type peptidyl-prolyl cis-trans isomerase [Dissulfurispiraceae bacterium]|nr:FKBP-type peptidyl-prolyl cis-trans isomerase [Dissulfurispiraceae bacterium]